MLQKLKRFFSNEYLDYDAYKKRIDFISVFYWQQYVRKQNLRGLYQKPS